ARSPSVPPATTKRTSSVRRCGSSTCSPGASWIRRTLTATAPAACARSAPGVTSSQWASRRFLAEASDRPWDTDDALDAPEPERRLLRDDDPGDPIDVDDVADARFVCVAVLDTILMVVPP